MKLHEFLKKLRITCGYTQQNIADVLGIDRSAYSYCESGKTRLSLENLAKLSNLYGITIDEMLGKPHAAPSRIITLSSPKLSTGKEIELEKFRTLSRDEQRIILTYRALSDKKGFLSLLADHIIQEERLKEEQEAELKQALELE